MKMLVLAGGFGTRLQSVVSAVPKAMAPVGKVPFLHLQIQHWKNQGINSFAFLLHHQADLIINFLRLQMTGMLKGCEVHWIVEPTPMDTGGAVAYAIEQLRLTGSVLVTNADTWLGTGITELHHAKAPAMAVIELRDAARYGRVRFDDRRRIHAFQEKSHSEGPGWINAGLCLLNTESFKGWDHRAFSLERQTFPAMAARGELHAVTLQTDFVDIGIPDDYGRFCCWIESGKKTKL